MPQVLIPLPRIHLPQILILSTRTHQLEHHNPQKVINLDQLSVALNHSTVIHRSLTSNLLILLCLIKHNKRLMSNQVKHIQFLIKVIQHNKQLMSNQVNHIQFLIKVDMYNTTNLWKDNKFNLLIQLL